MEGLPWDNDGPGSETWKDYLEIMMAQGPKREWKERKSKTRIHAIKKANAKNWFLNKTLLWKHPAFEIWQWILLRIHSTFPVITLLKRDQILKGAYFSMASKTSFSPYFSLPPFQYYLSFKLFFPFIRHCYTITEKQLFLSGYIWYLYDICEAHLIFFFAHISRIIRLKI